MINKKFKSATFIHSKVSSFLIRKNDLKKHCHFLSKAFTTLQKKKNNDIVDNPDTAKNGLSLVEQH